MKQLLSIFLFICSSLLLTAQSVEPLRITHGPWIQNLDSEGVTICWTTNLPSVPAILIAEHPSEEFRRVQNSTDGIVDGGSLLHKVRVSGLKPGTVYQYRLQSVEIMKYRPYQVWYGDTIQSGRHSFTTPAPEAALVSFTVFNDIHEKSGLLGRHLNTCDPRGRDLIFYNGDMLDYFEREAQVFDAVIDTSVHYFAGSVPFIWVRGNHETRGMLARNLKQYLEFPDNKYYHAFTRGPVRFVVLDCGEDKPDDNRYYYGMADYDHYRLEELEWLKNEVNGAAYRQAAFRVIVIHMPVHPGDGKWHGPLFLAKNFGPVLKEAGADLLLAGHVHRQLWMDRSDSGLGFPVFINAPGNRVEVRVDQKELLMTVIDAAGEVKLEKSLQASER